MPAVTGATTVYGIIADPVHHLVAPEEMNKVFADRRIDAIMVPIHLGATELHTFVASFRTLRNFAGLLVTVPHKQHMARLCDALGPEASAVHAVNIVRRSSTGHLYGETYDGTGFVRGLADTGIDVRTLSTLLVGAGGVAASIAFALAQSGVSYLTVANRSVSKARELVSRVRSRFPGVSLAVGSNDPTGHDLIINATSLGLNLSDHLPIVAERLQSNMIVAEVIMRPDKTHLLELAEERGCRVQKGQAMLAPQLPMFLEFFSGVTS